jgi:HEAT repeat protein
MSLDVSARLADMHEADWPGWCRSVEALGRLDPPPVAELLAGLRSSNGSVRKAAAWVLGALQSPEVASLLRFTPPWPCRPLRPLPAEAAFALAEAVNDPDREVRRNASWALMECDLVPPAALEPLLGALNWAASPNERFQVAFALSRIGPAALQALRTGLHSPDRAIRRGVLLALGHLGGWDEAIADLTACLGDGSPAVRRDAARTLGRMGAAARPAVPALVAAARDPCQSNRRHALDALRAVGDLPAEVVPALVERLSDPIPNVRRRAVGILKDMGVRAAPAAVPLTVALDDPNSYVVLAALDALGRLGSAAAPAVLALRQLAGRSSQSMRRRVRSVLACIEAYP